MPQGTVGSNFNPLHPCGRRLDAVYLRLAKIGFQSTPPVWAETSLLLSVSFANRNFNPLHPCGRRRRNADTNFQYPFISIHSTRVGGDSFRSRPTRAPTHFNPLHPCGRRRCLASGQISLHSGFQSTPPVWAETCRRSSLGARHDNFNPLHPCGRRRSGIRWIL